jgi:hypothetical protein
VTEGTSSTAIYIYTGISTGDFTRGTYFTTADITTLGIANVNVGSSRYAATSYTSRTNTYSLTSSHCLIRASLLGSFWFSIASVMLTGEPAPQTTTTVNPSSKYTISIANSVNSISVAETALAITDIFGTLSTAVTGATASAGHTGFAISSIADSGAGNKVGFYKTGTLTISFTNSAFAGGGQYVVSMKQQSYIQGAWNSPSSGGTSAISNTYTPALTTTSTTDTTYSFSFYVDDMESAPSVTAVALTKTNANYTYVSGVSSLANSASALTLTAVVTVQNPARFFLSATTADVTVSTLSLTSGGSIAAASDVIYTDVGCTAALATSTAPSTSTNYYRKFSAIVLSTQSTTGVVSSCGFTYKCYNPYGASNSYTSASFSDLYYDQNSVNHWSLTMTKHATYGERVTAAFSGSYPNITGTVTYSTSQLIVSNVTNTYYNTECILYNGLFCGSTSSGFTNYTTRAMPSAPSLPNYTTSAIDRYATFKFYTINTSTITLIKVVLDGAVSTGSTHTVYYKFKDNAGVSNTQWLDITSEQVGSANIITLAEGSYARSSVSNDNSVTAYNVATPTVSSAIIYICVKIPSGSSFAFSSVHLENYSTGSYVGAVSMS